MDVGQQRVGQQMAACSGFTGNGHKRKAALFFVFGEAALEVFVQIFCIRLHGFISLQATWCNAADGSCRYHPHKFARPL